MRFVYGDEVYAIEFQRHHVIVKTWPKVGGQREYKERMSKYPHTTVIIYKCDPKELGLKNAQVEYVEVVGCYYKDRYTPQKGHVAALKKLTANAGKEFGIPKGMVSLIWQAYHRRNDPDAPVPTGPADDPLKPTLTAEIVKKYNPPPRTQAVIEGEVVEV